MITFLILFLHLILFNFNNFNNLIILINLILFYFYSLIVYNFIFYNILFYNSHLIVNIEPMKNKKNKLKFKSSFINLKKNFSFVIF